MDLFTTLLEMVRCLLQHSFTLVLLFYYLTSAAYFKPVCYLYRSVILKETNKCLPQHSIALALRGCDHFPCPQITFHSMLSTF